MAINLKQLKNIGDTSVVIAKWTDRAIKSVKTINTASNTQDISGIYSLMYAVWLEDFRAVAEDSEVTFATATDAQIKEVCFNGSPVATVDAVDTIKAVFAKVEALMNDVKAAADVMPANDL